jgi:hypothetical protein
VVLIYYSFYQILLIGSRKIGDFMTKILDARDNPEIKKELDTQKDVDEMIYAVNLLDARFKPGAFIERYRARWKNLGNIKAHHLYGNAIRWLNEMRAFGAKSLEPYDPDAKRLIDEFDKKIKKHKSG